MGAAAQQVPVAPEVTESSTTNYVRESSNLNAFAPAWDGGDQMETNTEEGVQEGSDDREWLPESSIDLGAERHSDHNESEESSSRVRTSESAVEEYEEDQAVPESSTV